MTIVTFGDSITAARKSVNQVFAQRLPALLLTHGIDATVINAGVGSSHSGRLSDNNVAKVKHGPDLVIIGFGTNDRAPR